MDIRRGIMCVRAPGAGVYAWSGVRGRSDGWWLACLLLDSRLVQHVSQPVSVRVAVAIPMRVAALARRRGGADLALDLGGSELDACLEVRVRRQAQLSVQGAKALDGLASDDVASGEARLLQVASRSARRGARSEERRGEERKARSAKRQSKRSGSIGEQPARRQRVRWGLRVSPAHPHPQRRGCPRRQAATAAAAERAQGRRRRRRLGWERAGPRQRMKGACPLLMKGACSASQGQRRRGAWRQQRRRAPLLARSCERRRGAERGSGSGDLAAAAPARRLAALRARVAEAPPEEAQPRVRMRSR